MMRWALHDDDAPRIGALISMPIATYLTGKADTRLLIAIGLALMAGSLWMMTGFDLEMGQEPLIVSGLVQGVGIGFVFLPLNILAFSTLAPHLRTEGAAFYNLARSVGGSITISIMGALLSRNVQVSHSDLAAHLTSTGLPVIQSGMLERFGVEGATVARMIDAEINRQALMIAYLDDFLVMQWVALLALPLILFMRRAEKIEGAPPVHIE
jgi:DHA2 family multidrug resistance protein